MNERWLVYKYIALIWDPTDAHSDAQAMAIQARSLGADVPWQIAYRNKGAAVMHRPAAGHASSTYPLANNQGAILGALFCRTNPDTAESREARLTPAETQLIIDSRGRHLIQRYWGTYLAIVRDNTTGVYNVLRDPTGNLPCYYTKCDRIHVFFSEMEDLLRYFPARLSIDWSHLAARLLAGFHYSRECGLREIEDILGGEWITLSAKDKRHATLWHPAQFCKDSGTEDEREAAMLLRSTMLNVVRTLSESHSNVLLRLSGGLDSSIVATCLAQHASRPHVTCVNFYIATDYGDEASGPLPPGLTRRDREKVKRIIGAADEREFARFVATKCGFSLIEKEKRASDLRFDRMEDAPLVPRPSHFALLIFEDDVGSECAMSTRSSACFGGEAGDTVLYNTQRAIGALDYAYLHPFSPGLLRHIRVTAHLSRESYPRVLWKSIKHGLLRAPLHERYDRMGRPHLLVNDAANGVGRDHFRHPWIDSSPRLCPGKRQHLLGISNYIATYAHVLRSHRIAPSVHPFASQPVVEFCLRTPTYVLLADGVSRGLARRAFRDILPPEIVRRTVKGGSMAFLQDVVRVNLNYIRERLLDGILVRERLLDRDKLESFLVKDQAFLSVTANQIVDYLACEGWASQLIGHRAINWSLPPPSLSMHQKRA